MLSKLPRSKDPSLLVGTETSDDAGVYKLNNDTALIQTVDFFTPIVDDPYTFGQIATANSLSDVYAMGGKPITAMNIIGFPLCQLGGEVLFEILRGGYDKVSEAGAVIVGGHTIEDSEPKYGLSVTGVICPDKVLRNTGIKVKNSLVLTKAIGTGVLSTAFRAGLFPVGFEEAIVSMKTLNRRACEIASSYQIDACTDITGFGLLGHIYEMAVSSQISLEIYASEVPFFKDALEAAAMGLVPAGAYANRNYLQKVEYTREVAENIKDLLYDPQTSGGLLFSLPNEVAGRFVEELRCAGMNCSAIIGTALKSGEGEIYVS